MDVVEIPNDALDVWLAELKPYQSDTLRKFMETRTPEQAAEAWLTTIGNPNIAAFGGQSHDPKPFWERFKAECRRFLCDKDAYAEEKKGFKTDGALSKPLLISVMSTQIAATLGTTGPLLAPAITVMLFLIGSMTINAYCSGTD